MRLFCDTAGFLLQGCFRAALEIRLKGQNIDLTTKALVMGVLNRTPDSFYDKGSYFSFDAFLQKAESLVGDGVDILDVGGVKAGPGEEVTEEEELERVVPAVEALNERFDVYLSVDTWSTQVLKECLSVGASIGNDISGFGDPNYLEVAASAQAAVVATHIRLKPRVKDPDPRYGDLIADVSRFLIQRAEMAKQAGVDPRSIVVDVGFDLGKTTSQSMALFGATKEFAQLGYPLLVSASNKGFLGETLNLDITARREASLSAVALSMVQGARIFRVHDVKGTKRVVDTLSAVMDPTNFSLRVGEQA